MEMLRWCFGTDRRQGDVFHVVGEWKDACARSGEKETDEEWGCKAYSPLPGAGEGL